MTWRTLQLKRLFISATGGSWGSEPEAGEVVVPCIRGTDFDYARLRVAVSRAPLRGFTRREIAYRAATIGDLIIEKSGGGEQQPVGRAVLYDLPDPVMPTNFAGRLRPNEYADPRFVCYLLASLYTDGRTRAVIKQTTGIQNLDLDALLSTVVRSPPIDEQRAIADFLDRETARIDALIAAKRRMIELLDEIRRSIISSVLWADNCPTVRLKYLCGTPTSGNRDHGSFTLTDDGVPCLRGLNVRSGRIDRDNLLRISVDDHQRHATTALRAGDLVIVRSGLAGAAALVPSDLDGCNCVDLVVVRRARSVLPRFLEYLVNSEEAQVQVTQDSAGALLTHFNAMAAANLHIPHQSIDEQARCVSALDESCSRLDAASDGLRRQIGLLIEHRQALITAAVTGELDVAGVAA